jgi:hypothetical protein
MMMWKHVTLRSRILIVDRSFFLARQKKLALCKHTKCQQYPESFIYKLILILFPLDS